MDFLNFDQNVLLCFFYIEAQVICSILMLFLFFKNHGLYGEDTKTRFLSTTIVCMIIYAFFDAVWALCFFKIIPYNDIIIKYTRIGYYIAGGFATYAWFMHIELLLETVVFNSRKLRIYLLIPIFVSTILVIFVGIFGPDPTQKNIASYLTVLAFTAIPLTYMIFASIHAIILSSKKTTLLSRRTIFRYGLYPILLMALAVLQTYFQEIPILIFGTTMLLVALFINSQSKLVSADALTGLNNRNELEKYLNDVKELDELAILMIDIDRFKLINDRFGHIEGDKAIVYVSNSLKRVLSSVKQRHFLGRYGGDEFIIVARTSNSNEIDELISNITEEVKNGKDKSNLYEIELSIGFSIKSGNISIKDLLDEADKNLYTVKEIHHKIR